MTYLPLCHEVVEVGVPNLDGRQLEEREELFLLVCGLLHEFVDLHIAKDALVANVWLTAQQRTFSFVKLQIAMPKR